MLNFAVGTDLGFLLQRLYHGLSLTTEWFECKNMTLNGHKYHLLASDHSIETVWEKVGHSKSWGNQ